MHTCSPPARRLRAETLNTYIRHRPASRRSVSRSVRRLPAHRVHCLYFRSCANAAATEALDAMSTGPTLTEEYNAVVALRRASHHTHMATEESARIPLGYIRLTKGGQTVTDADKVIAKLAHDRSVHHGRRRSQASLTPHTIVCFLHIGSQPPRHQQSGGRRNIRQGPTGQALEPLHPASTPAPRRKPQQMHGASTLKLKLYYNSIGKLDRLMCNGHQVLCR
jgi:hypothetical protein